MDHLQMVLRNGKNRRKAQKVTRGKKPLEMLNALTASEGASFWLPSLGDNVASPHSREEMSSRSF